MSRCPPHLPSIILGLHLHLYLHLHLPNIRPLQLPCRRMNKRTG
uniref:Uncharacterized protein n=1 Tax=Zea mays TaxID=4577 RepID=C0PNM9_MAIZE|nr:unknown [Zea mays]